jgi:hypothetical protein
VFSDALSTYYSTPSTVSVTVSDPDGVSLNTISVTINSGLTTEHFKIGDYGITYSSSVLTIPASIFDRFSNPQQLKITVGALNGKLLYNSKSLTLLKSDTLSVLTLLNSPNPFDPTKETTTFHVELSQDADVSMSLYSLGLQKVKEFPTKTLQAGYHKDVTWDGRDENGRLVPNGVYVLLFKAVGSGQTSVRRYKVAVLRR